MEIVNKKPPVSAKIEGAKNNILNKNNTILGALIELPLTRFDDEILGVMNG
jgi:hypothetical protein